MADNQFPQPSDPEQRPDFDDSLDDLQREDQERQGNAPLPYKTWKFWLSLVGVSLGFVLLSGVLAPASAVTQVVVFVVALLGHLGFGLGRDAENATERNYQKPAFWLSIAAYATSFALGSGLQSDQAAQITAMAVVVLSYFGYNTRAWVRRDNMVSPLQWPRFVEALLRFLVGYSKEEQKQK